MENKKNIKIEIDIASIIHGHVKNFIDNLDYNFVNYKRVRRYVKSLGIEDLFYSDLPEDFLLELQSKISTAIRRFDYLNDGEMGYKKFLVWFKARPEYKQIIETIAELDKQAEKADQKRSLKDMKNTLEARGYKVVKK